MQPPKAPSSASKKKWHFCDQRQWNGYHNRYGFGNHLSIHHYWDHKRCSSWQLGCSSGNFVQHAIECRRPRLHSHSANKHYDYRGGTEAANGQTIYYGPITAISSGVLTVPTSSGSVEINTASASNITLTTSSSFAAITVGMAVEVNGPEVSATEYTGHQINLNGTPAVVGQFD